MHQVDKEDPQLGVLADLLCDSALLSSGFTVDDASLVVQKLEKVLRHEAGVPDDAQVQVRLKLVIIQWCYLRMSRTTS